MSEQVQRLRLPILGSAAANVGSSFFTDPPDWHRFDVEGTPHLLVADGSRIYELSAESALRLADTSLGHDRLAALGVPRIDAVDDDAPSSVPLRSISLAVAQKCNLGCTYCYAEGGDFGATPRNMSLDVAKQAIDLLLEHALPTERFHLAFLGGEPLTNRAVLVAATEYAVDLARAKGARLGLSITSNATLLTEQDAVFFERHGFAVTVSLDGVGKTHDALRPFKSGEGSYERIISRVAPLLAAQRRMQVSARVTVTPSNLRLRETLDQLLALGFASVGFSPMLASPTGQGQMAERELAEMLAQMLECGATFERHVLAGRRYPFSNLVTALQELHRGTHRPYPCGAGAGYMGVSADGDLQPCHRFVQDDASRLGSVVAGVDATKQSAWLRQRHVHAQQPCSRCWARYLCGGGCHHEVLRRGRPACEYIRGWLDYCLEAYVRLRRAAPGYFADRKSPTPSAA